MEFEELEKAYAGYIKKYKLPSFQQLNEDFEIEKIDRNSGTMLRLVRKVMIDKVVNSINFLDMLLNPNVMNVPRTYFSFVKSIGTEERKLIEQLYDPLAKLSVLSIEREISYSEKEEAVLIKEIFQTWTSLKPKFGELIKKIKQPNNTVSKKERSYLG